MWKFQILPRSIHGEIPKTLLSELCENEVIFILFTLTQLTDFNLYTGNQWKRNTCIFDIFLTWTLSIKILFSSDNCSLHILSFFVLIDFQYALFKSTCSKKKRFQTPCYALDEWFVFLLLPLLADWVDYIFPTSESRYMFSISKYSKMKS